MALVKYARGEWNAVTRPELLPFAYNGARKELP